MLHPSAFESYIEKTNLQKLLEEPQVSDTYVTIKEIKHFTEKEAEKRDQIVLGYFGEYGVNRIAKSIVEHLLSPPKLRVDAEILDVGAGSGFFTVRVADKIHRRLFRL